MVISRWLQTTISYNRWWLVVGYRRRYHIIPETLNDEVNEKNIIISEISQNVHHEEIIQYDKCQVTKDENTAMHLVNK